MAESPVAVTECDCSALSCPIQCCNEANKLSGASQQLVMVTFKVGKSKDEQAELVIGKTKCVPLHFLDSFKMMKSNDEQAQLVIVKNNFVLLHFIDSKRPHKSLAK